MSPMLSVLLCSLLDFGADTVRLWRPIQRHRPRRDLRGDVGGRQEDKK